jgi:hypothetical protein
VKMRPGSSTAKAAWSVSLVSRQRSKPQDVFATRELVYALHVDLGLRPCVTK